MQRRSVLKGMLASSLAVKAGGLMACSLAFVNDKDVAKVVVRSMDLPKRFPEDPKLFVFPRGMTRDSGRSTVPGVRARVEGLAGKPLGWTSKFGSAAVVSFKGFATDGLNEKGLAAHLLVLEDSQHEPQDSRTELPDVAWAQYVLDNFASVKDVVEAHRAGGFRVVAGWSSEAGYPKPLGLHLAVQDDSGDAAIFEYVKGKLVVHHGAEYRVMTNDPPMDEMLVHLKQYKGFGGNAPIPGDVDPEHRFVRLMEYYKYLPQAKNYTDAVANALSLLRVAQVPSRQALHEEQDFWAEVQTNWVSAADVTNRIYYVNSATVPSLLWLDLQKVDFRPGAPIKFLDPHDARVGGDARVHLKPWRT